MVRMDRIHDMPLEIVAFDILSSPHDIVHGPRLGRLRVPGRKTIETPHYLALTSRGAVPHLSQDMMRDNTNIGGVYAALEDFDAMLWQKDIERAPKQIPPVYKFPALPHKSQLRQFIALQEDGILVLGPRRNPPLPCPASNTWTAISIVTSVGFSMLESEDYVEAVQTVCPDIVLAMGDVVYGEKMGLKRMEKMGDRTLAWMKELLKGLETKAHGVNKAAIFAPILPVDREMQLFYLDYLDTMAREALSGIVLYESNSVASIPTSLQVLPRISLEEPRSPHQILRGISLGIDVFTVPFIGAATDAGIALSFQFPIEPLVEPGVKLPFGTDMWSSDHAADLSPLVLNCQCYACLYHHRAYVQHLLSAKEMLGWVMLQVHNHHTVDLFFSGVRQSIVCGSFHSDKDLFEVAYEVDLPSKTARGPRVRGYQFKSEGRGEPKKNPSAYRILNNSKEVTKEAPLPPSPSSSANDLMHHGFAEQSDTA